MTPPKSIVVVGGGTAGWLTASLLAAKKRIDGAPAFAVTVIEPDDVPGIGVGEGTWPSTRLTLRQIGVSERAFLGRCGASFKQGTKFIGWARGGDEQYYHPFDRPVTNGCRDPADEWLGSGTDLPFARFVGVQEALCEDHRAPKLATSREFAGVLNYGYHFEADALSRFLRAHACENLGVSVVSDTMADVVMGEGGAVPTIKAIATREHGAVAGDFFVDCTGFRALIVAQRLGAKSVSLASVLLADRAFAARVPYGDDPIVESTTNATARDAGWIWDVSLSERFGVGYVHSSTHTTRDDALRELDEYLAAKGYSLGDVAVRELSFSPHHLDECWIGNCAAIGLSSGFVEPLEASSIMLTETAASELADDLVTLGPHTAIAFNDRFRERWRQVVHFLKLHYVLSRREERFWRDNRDPASMPEGLSRDLAEWAAGAPIRTSNGALFPTESYQFVLNGMINRTKRGCSTAAHDMARYDRYARSLPTNAAWLSGLHRPTR